MAEQFVTPVESRRVGAQEPSHPRDQICPGRFHNQMKVIVHEAIHVNLPVGFKARLPERLEEQLPVLVIQKNRLLPIPRFMTL